MIERTLKQVVLIGSTPTPRPLLFGFGTESTLDRCGFYICDYQHGAIERPLEQVWRSVRMTQALGSWVAFSEALLSSSIAWEVARHQFLDNPKQLVRGADNLLVESALDQVRESRARTSRRRDHKPVYTTSQRARFHKALRLQRARYLERIAGLKNPESTNPIETLIQFRPHTPVLFGHWGLKYLRESGDIELTAVSDRWERNYYTTPGPGLSGRETVFPLMAAELACEIAATFLRDRAIVELEVNDHYRPWLLVREDPSGWVAGKLAVWEEPIRLVSEPEPQPESSERKALEVSEVIVDPLERFNKQPVPLRLLSVATVLSELLDDSAAMQSIPIGGSQIQVLRHELDALLAEEECVALERELQSLQGTIGELEQKRAAAQAAIEEQVLRTWAEEKEDERIETTVAGLRADETALASTITADNEALNPLRTEVEGLRNEREALQRRKRQLDAERQRLAAAKDASHARPT